MEYSYRSYLAMVTALWSCNAAYGARRPSSSTIITSNMKSCCVSSGHAHLVFFYFARLVEIYFKKQKFTEISLQELCYHCI